jgi:hypothetical protein
MACCLSIATLQTECSPSSAIASQKKCFIGSVDALIYITDIRISSKNRLESSEQNLVVRRIDSLKAIEFLRKSGYHGENTLLIQTF